MTQEEKAKRYDKAIEKAKAIYQCKYKPDTAAIIAETLQNIFPELKESERIRKGLIAIISDFESLYLQENYALSKEDAIVWLETQGVHANFRNGIQIGDKVTCNKDGVLVNLSQLNRVAKKDEKQGEQKPADKVESKFKIGDWVVYDHRLYQVVELPKEGYINLGLRRNEKIEFAPSPYCRLWTIQDAKDGDVLSYRDGQWIFIYKEKIDDNSFYYHILYSTIHQDLTINDSGFTLLGDAIIPATKEQRGLLFQKMKEIGYEWDAEKKELKKVEQKPVPKFEVGDVMRTLQEAANGMTDGMPIIVSIDDEYYHCTNELIAIKDQDDYEYPPMNRRQKHAWSEEDEKMYKSLETLLNEASFYSCSKGVEKILNWLKSLKDRIDNFDDGYKVGFSAAKHNQWKPSDEQMMYLSEAIDVVTKAEKFSIATALKELIEQIKKLREE